jgi:small-conductance mechanosensitive channel
LMNVPEYKFVITSPNGSLGGASFNNWSFESTKKEIIETLNKLNE